MLKKVMFISVVILVVSTAASADVWDWFFGTGGASQTPHSQQQWYAGYGGQMGVQIGPGYSAGTTGNSAGNTQMQSTPAGTGTQSTNVGNTQSTYISTYPNSAGFTYSDAWIMTYQGQFFLY